MNYINRIFCHFLNCFVIIFINNILIYFKTLEEYEEHEEHLRTNLQILNDKQLCANFFKCKLKEVNPTKVEVFLQWEPPRIVIKIYSFLRLTRHYKIFIERFCKIFMP